ncbi:MAG TPA: GatB/YqeY domain-containing protein [Candidatus Onthoplasma faecipullorum]|nr:GatB/YqeY domain-containing protein [Candidatus Onthoplasma faecipullorum]
MIIDEIKKANIQAMKDRNAQARAIYGVVMNKAMLNKIEKKEKGLEQTDADLVQILQKTIKELDEEKENYIKAGNSEQAQNIEMQKNLISIYLPKMMSEDEIRSVIGALEDKSIPSIMKHFKANFNGKVDMGTVNKIAREFN